VDRVTIKPPLGKSLRRLFRGRYFRAPARRAAAFRFY
jgi:hypothetical protein